MSGLILLAAAKADDDFAAGLLEAMGCDLDRLSEAVDGEWSSRSPSFQDGKAGSLQNPPLLNEAFHSVAAKAQPDAVLHLGALLATLLRNPDSMASRVAVRVGAEPTLVADRLEAS